MKVIAVLCLLVAGCHALDCTAPNPSFFTSLRCSLINAGHALLGTLEQTAVQAATQIGGELITGLQNVATAAANGSLIHLTKKRNIDIGTVLKLAAWVESHRQIVHEIGDMMNNLTKVTIDKLDGLVKDFTHNPNEQLLNKIVTYIHAHNVVQDLVMDWVNKNENPLTAFLVKELMATVSSHKREDLLSQVSQVVEQLSVSFAPLAETLKTLVSGAEGQVMQLLHSLVPNAAQLLHDFQPSAGLTAVLHAADEIVQSALKDASPTFSALVAQMETLLG